MKGIIGSVVMTNDKSHQVLLLDGWAAVLPA